MQWGYFCCAKKLKQKLSFFFLFNVGGFPNTFSMLSTSTTCQRNFIRQMKRKHFAEKIFKIFLRLGQPIVVVAGNLDQGNNKSKIGCVQLGKIGCV